MKINQVLFLLSPKWVVCPFRKPHLKICISGAKNHVSMNFHTKFRNQFRVWGWKALPSYCYCIECGVVYSVRGRYSKDTTARDMMWSQRTASYSGCTDSPDRDYATVPCRLYYCITALMDATLVGWWLDHLTA